MSPGANPLAQPATALQAKACALPKAGRLVAAVALATLSGVSWSGFAHAEQGERVDLRHLGTAPLVVLEDMRASGCQPVRNFYKTYRSAHPYVWIKGPSGQNVGHAFLCETVNEDDGSADNYKLVVESPEGSAFRACPREIGLGPAERRSDFEELSLAHGSSALEMVRGDGGVVTYQCVDGAWTESWSS